MATRGYNNACFLADGRGPMHQKALSRDCPYKRWGAYGKETTSSLFLSVFTTIKQQETLFLYSITWGRMHSANYRTLPFCSQLSNIANLITCKPLVTRAALSWRQG
ncbi:uncharacterized protein TM35_000651080 [Trypanosoma theileri]|uniref:Uncharacterized protein n=1 Tax=Trypanosoma theileri TaxID=67003 RepID=A0A1X0NFQ0_9TRYP|nr:uncharacterized protein TM35_000651080 [Trypanosoma theileri]ORC83546.1 hypothetical protein TM35_000651080 [Trypanosoma theileri]